MTKKFEFDWHIPIPEPLLTGCVFDRWTEEKDNVVVEQRALFKVDQYGFFIYWKSEGKEGDVIELCQVSDIRAGGLPKDLKCQNLLESRHGPDVEEKSLTICSGTDYININYQHIVCPNVETAKFSHFNFVSVSAEISNKQDMHVNGKYIPSWFWNQPVDGTSAVDSKERL